jgi:hypothetical protein
VIGVAQAAIEGNASSEHGIVRCTVRVPIRQWRWQAVHVYSRPAHAGTTRSSTRPLPQRRPRLASGKRCVRGGPRLLPELLIVVVGGPLFAPAGLGPAAGYSERSACGVAALTRRYRSGDAAPVCHSQACRGRPLHACFHGFKTCRGAAFLGRIQVVNIRGRGSGRDALPAFEGQLLGAHVLR